MESKYSSEWTRNLENSKQWERYWMQQNIMAPIIDRNFNIVEMGVGSGFCSNYLKNKGFKIETIDIDESKNPDIVCDLNVWNPTKQYDAFLSFQVFEHVPFQVFEQFIVNLKSLKIKYLFISVPFNYMSKKKLLECKLYLPKIGTRNFSMYWPPFISVPPRSKHHLWELNDKNISIKRYQEVFSKNGFKKIREETLYYSLYNVFQLND